MVLGGFGIKQCLQLIWFEKYNVKSYKIVKIIGIFVQMQCFEEKCYRSSIFYFPKKEKLCSINKKKKEGHPLSPRTTPLLLLTI